MGQKRYSSIAKPLSKKAEIAISNHLQIDHIHLNHVYKIFHHARNITSNIIITECRKYEENPKQFQIPDQIGQTLGT